MCGQTDFPLDDVGLLMSHDSHHLVWRVEGGALRWAPFWFRALIVVIWNHLVCWWEGHEVSHVYEDEGGGYYLHAAPTCIHCSRTWPCDGSCGAPEDRRG